MWGEREWYDASTDCRRTASTSWQTDTPDPPTTVDIWATAAVPLHTHCLQKELLSMNYYGAKELANSFRTVRTNTIHTAEDIPESQYGFTAAEGTRSIATTLVHIALSPQVID